MDERPLFSALRIFPFGSAPMQELTSIAPPASAVFWHFVRSLMIVLMNFVRPFPIAPWHFASVLFIGAEGLPWPLTLAALA